MEVMHNVYPSTAKYYLQKKGLHLSTFTRQKDREVTRVTRNKMGKLLNDYKKLLNDLELRLTI
jgi:4-hydroxy-tetrahydrodipicolinate synthase